MPLLYNPQTFADRVAYTGLHLGANAIQAAYKYRKVFPYLVGAKVLTKIPEFAHWSLRKNPQKRKAEEPLPEDMGPRKVTSFKAKRQYKRALSKRAFKATKRTVKNGHFSKVQYRKPPVNRKKTKLRRKFYKRVMRVINANTEKAHYIVQRTKRISTNLNLTSFDEIEFNTNIDFDNARKYCEKNNTTNSPMDKEKLHIRSMVLDLFLTNPTNICTYVDVYEITPKYLNSDESSFATPTKWLNLMSNQLANYGQPAGNSINFGTNVMPVGSSVFHVPGFFQKFKVKRKTRMLLQPGECHTRQIRWSKDFIWNPSSSNSVTVEPQDVTGFQPLETATGVAVQTREPAYNRIVVQNNKKTRYILFHVWGQPVNDNATKTIIGTSGAAVNIVYTVDYCVSQLPYVRNNQIMPNNVWVNSGLGTVITPVAVQEFNAPIANPAGPI
jgi:hypothetical protein